jgi:hypothetical protein
MVRNAPGPPCGQPEEDNIPPPADRVHFLSYVLQQSF